MTAPLPPPIPTQNGRTDSSANIFQPKILNIEVLEDDFDEGGGGDRGAAACGGYETGIKRVETGPPVPTIAAPRPSAPHEYSR